MKNIDHAILRTAKEWNLPEDKVRPVIMGYWEDIYKKLISGSKSAVTARHIGTFAISRYKIKRMISKRINMMKKIRVSDKVTDEKREEILQEDYKKLRKALAHRNDLATQYAKRFKNI